MNPGLDASAELAECVRAAAADGRSIDIRGGGSKWFYGNRPAGEPLDISRHAGIVAYDASELFVTARAGTRLAEIESMLAANQQYLPFEPPHFGPRATIGGCVAAGLSGPRRVSVGPLRDYVLGVGLLDGQGRRVRFGGQVMKNVAGFDVSRLIAGSMGTLGIILDVTLKLLPAPAVEATCRFEFDEKTAIASLNRWAARPLPISASAWRRGMLDVRLSGNEAAIRAARQTLGGEIVPENAARSIWRGIREQTDPFFDGEQSLWRVALPSTSEPFSPGIESLIEWHGGLRWLRAEPTRAGIRSQAVSRGGHATLFRGRREGVESFTPPSPPALALHQRVKAVFDPKGIFNRGRIFSAL